MYEKEYDKDPLRCYYFLVMWWESALNEGAKWII